VSDVRGTGPVKDRSAVELVDLALFGRPTRLCAQAPMGVSRWGLCDGFVDRGGRPDRLARQVLTPGCPVATTQVGRCARSVNEVATELGCDWHTVNDTVVAYGEALLEADTERIGAVNALVSTSAHGEIGPYHRQHFSTRSSTSVPVSSSTSSWSGSASHGWLAERRRRSWSASSSARSTSRALSTRVRDHGADATLVADPFHVVKLANTKLDECRRRCRTRPRHRAASPIPLRCRRLLTKAKERLDEAGHERLTGLLRAVIPTRRRDAVEAKEAVRELYTHADAEVASSG